MARYIADVNGILTEILPLNIPSTPEGKYGQTDNPADTNFTARSTSDANKMIELDANGLISKHFLPYRFITQAGTASSAGFSAVLDGTGRWHMSLMPVGVGAEVIVAPAAGALGGGKFCNINSSGFIRLASNAAVSTNANGFVLVGYADGATATMYGISNTNTALAGLATGTQYFLGTAGGVLATSPTTPTGTIVQPLGRAHAVDSLIFSNSEFFFVKTLPA